MITKEWRDARWKMLIGVSLALAVGVLIPLDTLFPSPYSVFGESENVVAPSPRDDAGYLRYLLWSQWFGEASGNLLLMAVAAVLGAGLVSSETANSTIFLLLSRPVSRRRVLLAKYAVGASVLFVVAMLGSVALLITAGALGYPQDTTGVLVSAALMWLGLLFVFGAALLLSVVLGNTMFALVGTLLVWVVTSVTPAFIAQQTAMFVSSQDRLPVALFDALALSPYWTSLPAYSGESFPTLQLMVSLVAAVLPPLAALCLFERKAY